MSWSNRRAARVLALVAALLVLVALKPIPAQDGKAVEIVGEGPAVPSPVAPTPKDASNSSDFSESLTLPRDSVQKGKLEAAAQYIESKNWEIAVPALQKLVDLDYDIFADLPRVGVNGRIAYVWVSVQGEADRLLGTLPKEGKDLYRAKFDGNAAELLKDARQSGSVDKLKVVVRKYRHTNPGVEAAALLAGYLLDRGSYAEAAREYDNLLDVEGWDKVTPEMLFKAAFAFRQAANRTRDNVRLLAKETLAWDELSRRRVKTLKLAGEERTLQEMQDFVAKLPVEKVDAGQGEFQLVGVNASRNGQLIGGPAYLKELWKQPMNRRAEGKNKVNQALTLLQQKGQTPLTPFEPLAIHATIKGEKVPLMIHRNFSGLTAVRMKNGKIEWESPSAWSLDRMAWDSKGGRLTALESFWQFFVTGANNGIQRPQVVFENSNIGVLTSDGRLVYAVDDLQMPPPPEVSVDDGWGRPMPGRVSYNQEVRDAISHNKLQAIRAESGKLAWELGGHGEKFGELSDAYFLGPPLPFEGKLYVLVEKKKKLRLVCLETYTEPDPKDEGKILDKVKIVSSQDLATVKYNMEEDVLRRLQASHLAYGEGVLVCPTNAGALLAFNLRTNRLMWAYSYRLREDGPEQWEPGMGMNRPLPAGWMRMPDGTARPLMVSSLQQWKMTPPVVADGKVVFTAPDARTLTCLDLKDGKYLWSKNRTEDELYLGGVFEGKVLVVGRKNTRALNLQNGETLWNVETGSPSGVGVCSENVYYVPLKESAQYKEPGIAAIDVTKGLLIGTTRSRDKDVPGNLVFFDDAVLSQTPTEVAAYPQLKARLAEIDAELVVRPEEALDKLFENTSLGLFRDQTAKELEKLRLSLLFDRGSLRLDKGDMLGSVEDLRKVLSQNPEKELQDKAKDKLYVTLTEFLLRDFARAETYLKEYEDLCKLDVEHASVDRQEALRLEERRRKVKMLCLIARGKESQGKLVEAFERYQECGSLIDSKELFSVVDEPTVKASADVLSQGRIVAMLAAASPEDRKPLEDRIAQKWQDLQKSSDLEELRKFVAVFGSAFAVGKEARLKLAERLMEEQGNDALLEAERHLSLLRGRDQPPDLKARALEGLARLNTRKGLMEDAAYFYRLLARDYGGVKLRDGKTGEELFNDLATDKRFLPYLDEPARAFKVGKMTTAIGQGGSFGQAQQVYYFDLDGEPLPFFRRHRIGLELGTHSLRVVDGYNGELRWNEALPRTLFGNIAAGGPPDGPKFAYQTLGHLMVLPVGNKVFGIDPVSKKKLWEFDLNTQSGVQPQMIRDVDGSIQFVYPDGWKQRLGSTGPLDGNAICVQTRDGLAALDPLTGRTLWTRSDVGPRNHIFGDDKYIFVVEVDDKNVAGATRALRARDGVAVKLADFSAPYQHKIRVLGHQVLYADFEGPRAVVALYDIVAGKNVWSQSFAAGSKLLKTEDPDLFGAVESTGKLRVVSLSARKEILQVHVDPQALEKAVSVLLLRDANLYYVGINNPPDPDIPAAQGGVQPNLMTNLGLRAAPVNGRFYAFKPDGKLWWELEDVKHQMIVLEQFQDMPMVLFTSRYNKQRNRFDGNQVFVAAALAYEKRTGKVLYSNEQLNYQGQNFHSLTRDPATRRIEFTAPSYKISFPYELPKEEEKK
jgi:outer membrane protein assembly factor BamB